MSLSLTVSKEYHNTVDPRLKAIFMFTKYEYNYDNGHELKNTLLRLSFLHSGRQEMTLFKGALLCSFPNLSLYSWTLLKHFT